MKVSDLGSGYFGNGLTVWARPSYRNIAHIADDGTITLYAKRLPADVREALAITAAKHAEECRKQHRN